MAVLRAPSDPPALTKRQAEALEALQGFQAAHGYPPTRAELGRLLGVSAQTADFHLRALARKRIVQVSSLARGIVLPPAPGRAPRRRVPQRSGREAGRVRRVPLVGRVAAGRPLLALENREGELPLPAGCGADFALRVAGDSMIEAGILDGDFVLVRKAATARKGEIVVALLGEGETMEATVKRYLPGRGRVVLRPANALQKDIVVRRGEPFELAGRVVGVLRLWS